jgi:hypothetical protein
VHGKQCQKSRAKTIVAASGKQAHQAKDNKTNLKMNSTDKPNADEKLKEETQTDLNIIFYFFQRLQKMAEKH